LILRHLLAALMRRVHYKRPRAVRRPFAAACRCASLDRARAWLPGGVLLFEMGLHEKLRYWIILIGGQTT